MIMSKSSIIYPSTIYFILFITRTLSRFITSNFNSTFR
nr:MAG TPA: hypothetical protein [Caudoviricetes sp.]